jgi:hypothetical protein
MSDSGPQTSGTPQPTEPGDQQHPQQAHEPPPRHGRSGDGFDSVIPAMQEQERQRRLDSRVDRQA